MNQLIVLTALLVFNALPPMIFAETLEARLSGYNEVHFSGGSPATLAGAISTGASGKFKAKIDERNDVIEYELSYEGLRGSVTQAHIHFGQRHTVGGIVVWLCETPARPAPPEVAALTPECPAQGSVTGTITTAQVLAQPTQGFDGEFGDFGALVRAIRSNAAYANVHSSLFGPGEIRGQIRASRKGGDKDKRDHKDKD
jgi:hypothetical protein